VTIYKAEARFEREASCSPRENVTNENRESEGKGEKEKRDGVSRVRPFRNADYQLLRLLAGILDQEIFGTFLLDGEIRIVGIGRMRAF
jgi:hypothetical protein